MLKTLSLSNCYDFSISKVFKNSFGESLKTDILKIFFNNQKEQLDIDSFREFLESVINDDRFIINNSKYDTISKLLGKVDTSSHGTDLIFDNSPGLFIDEYSKNKLNKLNKFLNILEVNNEQQDK
jgi:hypothetical protein